MSTKRFEWECALRTQVLLTSNNPRWCSLVTAVSHFEGRHCGVRPWREVTAKNLDNLLGLVLRQSLRIWSLTNFRWRFRQKLLLSVFIIIIRHCFTIHENNVTLVKKIPLGVQFALTILYYPKHKVLPAKTINRLHFPVEADFQEDMTYWYAVISKSKVFFAS